ncbi:MAG: hypothetical protein EAZ63_09875 [Runella slithyformis]|nr:MAG: hypothetical protein EAZ63_09875 [Runella slithyformis]
MDYKTFIEKGYPVSSALVESSDGAQNVMDIRAVKLNDDMEDFMDFRIKKEQLKRHSSMPLKLHLPRFCHAL